MFCIKQKRSKVPVEKKMRNNEYRASFNLLQKYVYPYSQSLSMSKLKWQLCDNNNKDI